MKAVLQRVQFASVEVASEIVGEIKQGLLVLVGFEENESECEMDWLIHKLINLRIFNDQEEVMNLSLIDVLGELLIVSQFTLHAKTKKGNRPSYMKSAKTELAKKYYDTFIQKMKSKYHGKINSGIFGANMKISLINDGPVTIIIDTKNKE